jgi:putative ABC transport system permease protein
VATLGIVGLLILFLLVILVITVVLALRHRLAFRIAMRNVRRGKARTILLVAGLLVGTTIITGSLIVGDTVSTLVTHYSYLGAGYVDESITGTSPSGGTLYFPYSVYETTVNETAGYTQIAGIAPMIVDLGSVYDRNTGIPETNLNLIGVNGNQSTQLGAFVDQNGASLDGPATGQVLIDQQTASAINASVGDALVVVGHQSIELTIQAIVQPNVRGAFITAGLSPGNVWVTLATAQYLENETGNINYIAITNVGTQAQGAASSGAVSAYLNATLADLLSAHSLVVGTPLQTSIAQAQNSGTDLQTIFLVLGLFSIIAGALLIVGIFVMLAEERKGEMGMLRAIGLNRGNLVYTYYFEGVVYSAGSALAGIFIGVGVGYLLIYLAGFILADAGLPANAITQSFTVTAQSLTIAYVAGFLLTLVTVVFASRRASRLNIVRAIRDIPEPPPPLRTYTWLAVTGVLMAVLGVLLYRATYQGSSNLSEPILGGGLVIVGVALVAARFLKNRLVFSAAGLALVVWAGSEALHKALWGPSHAGGIFTLFTDGIILVGGVLLILLFNADLVARGLRGALGKKGAASPVLRVGLDYPTRQPTKTAVSLTIFCLVIFTMVVTAGYGATLEGSLTAEVANQSGGYTFFGYSQNAIPTLWNDIESNTTLAPLFTNAGSLATGAADISAPGFAKNPYQDSVYAPPTNLTGPASFYATEDFPFSATVNGTSGTATFALVASNPSDAIVDATYGASTGSITGAAGAAHPLVSVGTKIEVASLAGTASANVTVVGILKQSIITGVWLNAATAARLGYSDQNGYFLTVAPGASATTAAQDLKRAFFADGLVVVDIESILASSINTVQGFIGLLEIFVGLGLGVGIAAMGILALRAVVERRRQIGMLRATGFTRGMILRSFLLEYSYVTIAGIAIGTGLGLLVVYNATNSNVAASAGITQFVAPWLTIVEIAVVTYLLVLAAIAAPALRAANLPPADAVRATE